MNTKNEFDLQFKIFTLVDGDITKSYVIIYILNKSMNQLFGKGGNIFLYGIVLLFYFFS